jgi:ADP-dependent NAD(P)H-hydrate dehydratase / NAD(P)H-hydrate epimerase
MILDEYLTAREIQAAEYNANYLGVSNLLLMETAGKAVAEAVAAKFKLGAKIFVACGLGGNGGDGFVAARHLSSRGYNVEVVLVGAPESIRSEETRYNYDLTSRLTTSLNLRIIHDSSEVVPINADAIVDALIGYTYHGILTPVTREMINAINDSDGFKVSIDVPTGMVVDTGETPEECVEANITVTLHKPKTGFRGKPRQLGKLVIASMGIPIEAELYTGPGDVLLAHQNRKPESHKGMFGRLLVVGGNETYHGAPALTTMGALSTGIDICYTAVPETAAEAVSEISPSMIVVKLKGERLNTMNLEQLKPFLEKVDAVTIGPGLGLAEETKKTVDSLIRMIEIKGLPLVVDADALKAFGENRRKLKVPVIFTPHSREFEILTGRKAEGTHLEKGAVVAEEAKKLGAVLLLKGVVDVISNGFHTRYNWTGNPGMTVGGTGDVLTGLTSGYLSQGVASMQAACAAAFLNGAAGDAVRLEKGYHILPEDLINNLPYLIEDAVAGKMRAT